jgi:hypothetical protein
LASSASRAGEAAHSPSCILPARADPTGTAIFEAVTFSTFPTAAARIRGREIAMIFRPDDELEPGADHRKADLEG